MFCPKCGFQITSETNFCTNCGSSLLRKPESTEPKKPTSPSIENPAGPYAKVANQAKPTTNVGKLAGPKGEMRFYKIILAILLFLVCVYTQPLINGALKEISIGSFVVNNFAYGFGFFVIYFLMGAAITLIKAFKVMPLKLFGLWNTGNKIEDIKPVSFIKSVSKVEDFISACFYANIIQLILLLVPSK